MMRGRDGLVDKKIGSVIRMQRVKLGMTQSELAAALGVTFQQIQKYEKGSNSVASSRIPDLCRQLEISPNDLFRGSDTMENEEPRLSPWAIKTTCTLQQLPTSLRQSVETLIGALAQPKR
jgi:transcriptional regulator with XRE-family HTH domain